VLDEVVLHRVAALLQHEDLLLRLLWQS
jgi:hypothetical protein